jgi:dUTP pyrophosphatase
MLIVKRHTATAKLPTIGHPGEDLGYDIYSDLHGLVNQMIIIGPRRNAVIPTGISVEFQPRAGSLLMTRSSMASNRVIVVGGVIDAGYRGEILVMLENLGDKDYTVVHGAKIAQLVVNPNVATEVMEVENLTSAARGGGAFGSTGK